MADHIKRVPVLEDALVRHFLALNEAAGLIQGRLREAAELVEDGRRAGRREPALGRAVDAATADYRTEEDVFMESTARGEGRDVGRAEIEAFRSGFDRALYLLAEFVEGEDGRPTIDEVEAFVADLEGQVAEAMDGGHR